MHKLVNFSFSLFIISFIFILIEIKINLYNLKYFTKTKISTMINN